MADEIWHGLPTVGFPDAMGIALLLDGCECGQLAKGVV